MVIERLNLNQPPNQEKGKPESKKEKRERSIFSETFRAVTLAGILLFGAQEGFKTAKEMAIVSEAQYASEYIDGKEIIKGEVQTAAGKRFKYEVPTSIDENAKTKQHHMGGGTIFDANISEITEDGSGVRIKVKKVLGRDEIEIKTDHFKKGGELEKTTFAYVSSQPQEVVVK
ncbi:MAG: hypothetical protein AAB907_00170 [Patescibacteria group bacterium]